MQIRLSLREKILILILLAVLAVAGFMIVTHEPAGPDFINPPEQTSLEKPQVLSYIGKKGTVQITLLAQYRISAVVKSRKNYTTDPASQVSPMDLVLAWGNLSQSEISKDIKYSQSDRWYFFRVKSSPLTSVEMVQIQSANTHIIPANSKIRSQMDKIRKYDFIELDGYLASVVFDPALPAWSSSLSRSDSGEHACEIMYVTGVTFK